MNTSAMWRRLDVPGHDAASLRPAGDGWQLRGCAVFQDEGRPAWLHYELELHSDWSTRSARVHGFAAGRAIEHAISREGTGWTHNGRPVAGLEHLLDLDLGFTPATNLQQLRRIGLRVGQSATVPVAWLDTHATSLIELPQKYERRSASTYWYESASVGYEAMLRIADTGFVSCYPGLWDMEGNG